MQPNTFQLPCPAAGLIPHRPPMLLVRQILARGEKTGLVDALAPTAGPFVRADGTVLPEIYIEIVAQASATVSGYDALKEGKSLVRGFLVGLGNINFQGTIRSDEELFIDLKETMEFGEITIVETTLRNQEGVVLTGELKVWKEKK